MKCEAGVCTDGVTAVVWSELVRPKMDLRLCEPIVDNDVRAVNGSPVSARASDDAPGLLRVAINAGSTSCGMAGGANRGVGATLGVTSSVITDGRLELDALSSLDGGDLVFPILVIPLMTTGDAGLSTSPHSPADTFLGIGDRAADLCP